MNFDSVSAIASAVLYEGYILYPYGPNALKNRQRWTFGAVFPREYVQTSGGDPYQLQVQCLVVGGAEAKIEARLRFLQIVMRTVEAANGDGGRSVPVLEVDGTRYLAWEEAIEQEVILSALGVVELLEGPVDKAFNIGAHDARELVFRPDGTVAGALVRRAEALSGTLTASAAEAGTNVFRLTLQVENHTLLAVDKRSIRALAQPHSFASTHILLGMSDGEFVSLMDPPPSLVDAVAGCDNQGLWPVLVGHSGTRDMMLAAPIILYDYPQIAPESPGDLFDSTEIDEILSLRILTMTDLEKRDMAAVDARARALLERTERLGAAEFARLHGSMRPPFAVGDRVRLRPRRRADIMDTVLDGKIAIIEAIERDFEDRVHLAVTMLDDPGRDFALDRMPGHRFFFAPDEVENLGGSL
jgi:hypothetical protein